MLDWQLNVPCAGIEVCSAVLSTLWQRGSRQPDLGVAQGHAQHSKEAVCNLSKG